MSHITAYYQLQKLPEEIKKEWKIKSAKRLDCVQHYNSLDDEPLSQCVNSKGMMFFYHSKPEHYVTANTKRISEIGLTYNSKNLSSIYIPIEHPEHGYGDVNGANDGLLFRLQSDLSSIDMFLIKNAKYFVRQYFQQFIDGELDEEIEQIKQQAKPFFNYQKAS